MLGKGSFAVGFSDGRVIPVTVKFTISFPGGFRKVEPDHQHGSPGSGRCQRSSRSGSWPIRCRRSGPIIAAAVDATDVVIVTIRERKALDRSFQKGGVPWRSCRYRWRARSPPSSSMNAAITSSQAHPLARWFGLICADPNNPKVAGPVPATGPGGPGISVLGFLIGDRTLIVGDSSGGVSSWQLLRDAQGRDFAYAEDLHFSAAWRDRWSPSPHHSGIKGSSPRMPPAPPT